MGGRGRTEREAEREDREGDMNLDISGVKYCIYIPFLAGAFLEDRQHNPVLAVSWQFGEVFGHQQLNNKTTSLLVVNPAMSNAD